MDDADRADLFIESVIDDHVKEAMRKAADIPKGESGECHWCGYEFNRIVNGACGKCRDKFGL
jgi:predicted Zn-ribbon and HTH transcriptional regulator